MTRKFDINYNQQFAGKPEKMAIHKPVCIYLVFTKVWRVGFGMPCVLRTGGGCLVTNLGNKQNNIVVIELKQTITLRAPLLSYVTERATLLCYVTELRY